MKLLRLLPLFLLLAFALTGCETLDQRDRSLLAQHHVSGAVVDKMSHGERLELADIVELSRKRLPDPFIIDYLKTTYAVYQLASSDVSQLLQAKVSKPVVDYLLATPSMYGAPRFAYPYPSYSYGAYGPYPYPYPYYDYSPPVILVNPYFHHHW